MQFLLTISASFFTCSFLHVFCMILPYYGNFKVLGKFKLLANVCVDITLLIMEESITKLRSSKYIGI